MKQKVCMLLMTVVAALMLNSCNNEDAREANVLDGTWTGYIETYYRDRWGLTGSDYRTTMYFYQQNTYGGYGYEVDYDIRSPYEDYYYCEFRWTVERGVIYIDYADSYNTVSIYDYALNSSHFRGYMDDGTTRDIYFDLTYTGSFDWDPYRRGYYYAPTRSQGEKGRYAAKGKFAMQTAGGEEK